MAAHTLMIGPVSPQSTHPFPLTPDVSRFGNQAPSRTTPWDSMDAGDGDLFPDAQGKTMGTGRLCDDPYSTIQNNSRLPDRPAPVVEGKAGPRGPLPIIASSIDDALLLHTESSTPSSLLPRQPIQAILNPFLLSATPAKLSQSALQVGVKKPAGQFEAPPVSGMVPPAWRATALMHN
ncbi:hypothetical protein Micbo1qcDRAFT_174321 [Microdochium bolleyi]|uniref:Uncharacterized protein n=1 Tax=Microdochium bolleyi TaxID=196109 RepID=A0A136J7U8_9PEZI|nr:hypothetical protein Micbo1qcDRAFT_174321 [Microdochium bolleyi]